MRTSRWTVVATLVMVIGMLIGIVTGLAVAGELDSPAAPTDPASARFTLGDVYTRLFDGTAGAKRSGPFVEPVAGPGTATMWSTDDIMGIAPAVDDVNGAAASDVAVGKTYWGLRSAAGGWGLQSGTMAPGPVGETGQVTCYDASGTVIACAGTGQDGDKRGGVAWPNPRFTMNGDGTTTDNLTGLIWLTNANCFSTRNWTTALADANALADGACGLTDGSVAGDWRLPSRFELESLLDLQFVMPALSDAAGTAKWGVVPANDAFSGVQSNGYWSSTSYVNNPSYAWGVYLNYGFVYAYDKANSYYVWPVRGGQ